MIIVGFQETHAWNETCKRKYIATPRQTHTSLCIPGPLQSCAFLLHYTGSASSEATHFHECCQTHLCFALFWQQSEVYLQTHCLSMAITAYRLMGVKCCHCRCTFIITICLCSYCIYHPWMDLHFLLYSNVNMACFSLQATFTMHPALTLESMEHFQLPWPIYAGHGSH